MENNAKPFLKWAGGKKQLLVEIDKRLPPQMERGEITRYIEPFVGGGAVFFHVMNKFDFDDSYIYDVNEELVVTYTVVKNDVDKLIGLLGSLQETYSEIGNPEKKLFYYKIRDQLNKERDTFNYKEYSRCWIERAAQLIFLNRTCYNGLFRVNSNGYFNVPYGRYNNPRILDSENLESVSNVLQNTQIHGGDFTTCEPFADEKSFVYFDPPYRPLNKTSTFTSYSKEPFDDGEQLRLAQFYRSIDTKGTKLMLSNSDPKNEVSDDDFFDQAYAGFRVERVLARRSINSKAHKRGPVREIIVTNY